MPLFNIAAGIIVLGILVFVHELGHFLVAKWLGVGVLKFSLGFGKKIVGRKWGETEYQIALVPLGGYVKLLGESPEEKVPESESSRSFTAQSVLKRTAIVVTGPVMNFTLTLLIWPFVFMIGIQQPSYLSSDPIVGWVEPDSPAARAGLLKGDRLVSVGGKRLESWESLRTVVLTSPNEELGIEFERNEQLIFTRLLPEADPNTGAGHAGIEPDIPKMVIASVIAGKPAHEAGMEAGDVVLSINGVPHQDYLEMLRLIKENPGTELAFEIRRGEETLSVALTPIFNPDKESAEIGISFAPGFVNLEMVKRSYGFLPAFKKGGQEVAKWTALTFSVLWKLVRGKFSIRHLGGPITIVRFAGQAAQSGIPPLLQFVAILSLQLAILNVLPIPVLDGGHLVFLLIETVAGKPVSPKKQEMAYKIGFVVLVGLILVVSYNDVVKAFFRSP
ncbi:MAG: RIP metalloprotease RseP [Proteobacteria bacterium]|nr:RIP metalloprotease RseP [Pseudomonadota bacterium]